MPNNLEIIEERRFYVFENQKLPSVTTILDLAYQKEWMRAYIAKKMAAEAASGVSKTEDEFLGALERATKESSEHGDDVHLRFERLYAGESAHFAPLDDWYAKYRPEIIYSEAQIANYTLGYAGKLDMIAIIDGVRYLIDLKTGMHFDASLKLQLAAYKNAEVIQTNGIIEVMPSVDRCAILWIPRKTPENWSFREVSVGSREFRAFSSCIDVANYHIANSNQFVLGREVIVNG